MTIGRIPSVEGGIQPTIVDAKGDLIAGVAADSVNRLAVGSNDQVLVADSSTSTGLAWKSYGAQFVAGKNKIINGDFGIWQRGTSFSAPASTIYTADRWFTDRNGTGATVTVSQQTFTPATAPVSGYEGTYFYRFNQSVAGSGGSFNVIAQRIEDVRVFAGQTATFSFWAKAASTITLPSLEIYQDFGSGGSGGVQTSVATNVSIGTSWTRYSYTVAIPSISGKTIGTGSNNRFTIYLPVNATFTFDLWGCQLEAGSVATPFTTATGTIQGELAACQRYYWRNTSISATSGFMWLGVIANYYSTTRIDGYINYPVRMRTIPSSVDFASISWIRAWGDGVTSISAVTINTTGTSDFGGILQFTTTGAATTNPHLAYYVLSNNSAGYIGLSAEL